MDSGVYVIPGWPRGFCPLHYDGGVQCSSRCQEARLEFGQVARELDVHWQCGELWYRAEHGLCADCAAPLRSGPTQWRIGRRCLRCVRRGNPARITTTDEARRRRYARSAA